MGTTTVSSTEWTGFYLGLNGGGTWGNPKTNILPLFSTVTPATISPSLTGGLFGGQIGYNKQIPTYQRIVLGIETDMNWSNLGGSGNGDTIGLGAGAGQVINNGISISQQTKWFGTLRPRIGVLARDYLLIYGTAGLAYGRVNENANLIAPDIQFPAAKDVTLAGWTAGGGAELAFLQHWSTKVEYLYYDLGSTSTITNQTLQTQDIWNNSAQLVRLGVNFRC